MRHESDASVEGLTLEQRLAAGTPVAQLFIEAGPGTGKTTVAAQRYGMLRFSAAAAAADDRRAVVAVSFTRAATWNLHRRVRRIWGPGATSWPHRIVTLDTIMSDLLHDLLVCGLITWVNGHRRLRVEDSWTVLGETFWTRGAYALRLVGGNVEIITRNTPAHGQRVPPKVIKRLLEEGACTHDDIRDVLEQALDNQELRARVKARLAATVRALIVDEIFDANDLDIAVIEMAVQAGISVTLVGDPWQALYVFRGARPEAVPGLLDRTAMRTLRLTRSFRWREPRQLSLAEALRDGTGACLERVSGTGLHGIDVVLALTWAQLWTVGTHVLPLAFRSFRGGTEEAAATLLLNHVTRNVFSQDAIYLGDALTTLAIADPEVPRQLEPEFERVLEGLATPGKAALNAAYGMLVDVVGTVSPRALRPAHPAHTGRLGLIAERLTHLTPPVPGLTTHQAKGREWNVVGVRLSEGELNRLATGLNVAEDIDRKLYVACTRARRGTFEV